MNNGLMNMLEDIKSNKFKSYDFYLDEKCTEKLLSWYNSYSSDRSIGVDMVVGFVYDLYIREDIDYYSHDEYVRTVSLLAEKYHFQPSDFLTLYRQFREMLYGATA